ARGSAPRPVGRSPPGPHSPLASLGRARGARGDSISRRAPRPLARPARWSERGIRLVVPIAHLPARFRATRRAAAMPLAIRIVVALALPLVAALRSEERRVGKGSGA